MKSTTGKLGHALDRIDAAFIAEMILSKLKLRILKDARRKLRAKQPATEIAAVRATEEIEPTSSYVARSKEHTFGRKEAGERIGLWSVPRKSAEVLRNLVTLTGARTVLEIGTSAGYSTIHLASAAKLNRGTVYTIELLPAKIVLAT